jgi:hypothetical protein
MDRTMLTGPPHEHLDGGARSSTLIEPAEEAGCSPSRHLDAFQLAMPSSLTNGENSVINDVIKPRYADIRGPQPV